MSCNILLVEDEPVARRNITIFLQNYNHNVHQAETGEAALDLISQVEFDSVISDLRLSGKVNGIDVLKRQQKTSPGRPLILITAFGSEQIQSEARAMGAIYIEKPLSLGRLLDSIEGRPSRNDLETVNRELQRQIAEREIAVEKLRESEERFRLLVSGVKDYAIYMLDPAGFVSTWNAGAERIKGYCADEIIGRHFSCFYCPEDIQSRKPTRALITAAAEGKYEEESLRVRKGGSQFWASVLITALYDNAGKVRGYAKVVRDITERKENEEKLYEKERLAALGTTAAVFAHEVGNFLNDLSTSIELVEVSLKKAGNLAPIVQETIQGASREVEHLASLLKDYRSFARPQHLNLEAANLNRIIEEVLASLLRGYRASGVYFNIDFRDDCPLVAVDKEKIKQVMLNLFKNSFEAMPAGGVITCRGYPSDDGVMVEVSDTGTGIAEGINVFQLFQTTKPDGTGLGLPIVEQIVSDHQGTINYVSEIGKGTTFRLWLPQESRDA